MTTSEIRFALTVNGVEDEDIETLIHYSKTKGINYNILDEMLLDMGYQKVFTDEYFGWADDEEEDYNDTYYSSEKFRHKPLWDE